MVSVQVKATIQKGDFLLTIRNFYLWMCIAAGGSCLCQLYKSIIVDIVCIIVISMGAPLLPVIMNTALVNRISSKQTDEKVK